MLNRIRSDPHSFGSVIRIHKYKIKEKVEFNQQFFLGNSIFQV